MIKVSVIITTYNSEKYLDECIESVLNQSLSEIEIIIVDDGSTDNTAQVIDKYIEKDSRIRTYRQKHATAGKARNLGMDAASGKYLMFLDSDDSYETNMLEDLYNKAESDESDIVICEFDYFNDKTKERKVGFRFNNDIVTASPFSPFLLSSQLFKITNPAAWNKLFKKDFIKSNSIRFEDLQSTNDLTFTFSALAFSNKISIVDSPYVNYRIHHDGNISQKRNKSVICWVKAISSLEERLKERKCFVIYKSTFYDLCCRTLRYEKTFLDTKEKFFLYLKSMRILSLQTYFNILISKRLNK